MAASQGRRRVIRAVARTVTIQTAAISVALTSKYPRTRASVAPARDQQGRRRRR